MTIHIDINLLIDKLTHDEPLTDSERMFLANVCHAMYYDSTLDHLTQPGDTKH